MEAKGFTDIHIEPSDFRDWEDKAAEARNRVIDAISSGQKPKFKAAIWAALKIHLLELFDGKCAYCESKMEHITYGDVDHFRPKGGVESIDHPGYYWLAFDPKNMLPSCTKCNREAKKTRFPVDGWRANNPGDDTEAEKNLILNPYDTKPENDPKEHLVFPIGEEGLYLGTVKGVTTIGENTVNACRLDRFELDERRREEQENTVNALLINLTRENYNRFREIWNELRSGKQEFSAAALAQAIAWKAKIDTAANP